MKALLVNALRRLEANVVLLPPPAPGTPIADHRYQCPP